MDSEIFRRNEQKGRVEREREPVRARGNLRDVESTWHPIVVTGDE